MDGRDIVPGVAVVGLQLGAAAEGLHGPPRRLRLQAAEAQGEPAFGVQRVHRQRQLPVFGGLRVEGSI